MACCGTKALVMQVIVIAAVGVGAGLIDSTRRPIKIGRVLPPDFPRTSSMHTTGPAGSLPAAGPKPTITQTRKPGDPGWTPTPEGDLPKGQITLEAAKQLFDSSSGAFVDARRKADYEQGHIKGAMRINLKSFENGDPPLLAMIPRESFVVVYCSGGDCDESEHVAEFMSNSGYKKVYVIHDGYPGWNAMGWPVETGEGLQ